MPYEKVGKNEPVCIADEMPFDIPDNWEWVRIKNLGAIIRGSGIKRNETVESGFPCVRYGEIYTTYNTLFTSTVSFIPEEINEKCKHFSYGDILMTLTGENKPDIAKAVAYLGEEPVAAGGDLAFWTAHGMNPLYLVYLLASPYVISRKVELATGDIIVHISGDKIGSILIPIPPLNEQMRIVEKIQETECQIRQYSEKEQELTILHRAFPEALKKSILLQAVQGKLVEQDPTDEPAEVLLERIRAEKQRLVKEGKIKKNKHESIIFRRDNSHYEKCGTKDIQIDDDIPFDLPSGWAWSRLRNLTSKVGAGSTPQGGRSVYVEKGVKFIRSQNVYDDGLRLGDIVYITEETNSKKSGSIVCPQDILLNITGGSIGRCAVVPDDFDIGNVNQHVIIIRLIEPEMRYWIHAVLTSPYIQNLIMDVQVGVSREGLSASKLMDFFIPVPPVNEQKRILASVGKTNMIINSAL